MSTFLEQFKVAREAATQPPWKLSTWRTIDRGLNDHGGSQPTIEITGDDHPDKDAELIVFLVNNAAKLEPLIERLAYYERRTDRLPEDIVDLLEALDGEET